MNDHNWSKILRNKLRTTTTNQAIDETFVLLKLFLVLGIPNNMHLSQHVRLLVIVLSHLKYVLLSFVQWVIQGYLILFFTLDVKSFDF